MSEPKTMMINNIEYVRKEDVSIPEVKGDFVIVLCRNAGVHAGTLVSRENGIIELANSRRLWRWWSSFTLSALAMEGPLESRMSEQKYECVLPKIYLTESDVCEVIPCTDKAKESIMSVFVTENE